MTADRIGHDDGTPEGFELQGQCWMLAAKWMLATDLVQVDGQAFLQSVGQLRDQQSQILVDLYIVNFHLLGVHSRISLWRFGRLSITSLSRLIARRYRMLAAGSDRPKDWAIS